MADTFQERYGQSVRCLICARPARRGATLCAQCKAALRRARHTPDVKTEYLPQGPAVRTDTRRSIERKSPYSRPARRASRAPAPPVLGGWGTYATIIAFGLAVCLTGYIAIGDGDRFVLGRSAAPAPAAQPAPVSDEARDATVAKSRPPMPSLAVDDVPASSRATDSEASYDTVGDEHVAVFESLAPAPRATPDRKAAREEKDPKQAIAPRRAAKARNGGAEVPPAAVAPTPAAVASTALPEPIAPDRFAQFAAALARCEGENAIAALVCKERARLQYCEGAWGVAAQCPAAMASLNTR